MPGLPAEFLAVVRATFAPDRTDDLVPGAAEWIGRTQEWQNTGPIEQGPYEGEDSWAPYWTPGNQPDECPPFAWVPARDLELVALVRDGLPVAPAT